jgi:hypothetical protein
VQLNGGLRRQVPPAARPWPRAGQSTDLQNNQEGTSVDLNAVNAGAGLRICICEVGAAAPATSVHGSSQLLSQQVCGDKTSNYGCKQQANYQGSSPEIASLADAINTPSEVGFVLAEVFFASIFHRLWRTAKAVRLMTRAVSVPEGQVPREPEGFACLDYHQRRRKNRR